MSQSVSSVDLQIIAGLLTNIKEAGYSYIYDLAHSTDKHNFVEALGRLSAGPQKAAAPRKKAAAPAASSFPGFGAPVQPRQATSWADAQGPSIAQQTMPLERPRADRTFGMPSLGTQSSQVSTNRGVSHSIGLNLGNLAHSNRPFLVRVG